MESKPEKRRRRTAGWIGFPSISFVGALKLLEWLFSLGGAPENAEGWRKAGLVMLSVMPPWLIPALLVGGGVALLIYLVGVVPEIYCKSRHRILTLAATPDGVKRLSTVINIAGVAVLVALLGGLVYYYFFVYEFPPKPVWTHPTLTVSDQEQAKAKCRMRASETFKNRVRYWEEYHQYEADCLTAKGFRRERIDGE